MHVVHYMRTLLMTLSVVLNRMNVDEDAIKEHYDSRTEREKMEQRRDFLDDI